MEVQAKATLTSYNRVIACLFLTVPIIRGLLEASNLIETIRLPRIGIKGSFSYLP